MFGVGDPDARGRTPVSWSPSRPPRPSKPGFVHRAEANMDVSLQAGLTLPVVLTQRLTLCGLTEQYLDEFTRLQYAPRVAEWLGGVQDPVPSWERQKEDTWRVMATFLGHWALRGCGQWALVETATGRLVGRAGLWFPEGWPGLEVGWLVDPDRWGEGFATEAGRAAVDVAFDSLDADEVISVTRPDNARSRRVMQKVGLTDSGTTVELRDHTQVLYRLTRLEWMADVHPATPDQEN